MNTPHTGDVIRAGLVGVTGYTGMELARIAATHPFIRLTAVTSRGQAGRPLKDVYTFLQGFETGQINISEPDTDALAHDCDVVFLAVPHGTAMDMAGDLRRKGVKVVDLSADFRLHDASVYKEWYGLEHKEPDYLAEAVYGLPELYADEISKANLVANPGCYPTASILGVYPLLKNAVIETDGIIIDAKSGTTGAGRKASVPSLFSEVYDSFRPYGMPGHRHTPEIEQELGAIAGVDLQVSFNPHLLPINRGILTTIYTRPLKNISLDEAYALYEETYAPHHFVRLLPKGRLPDLRSVRGTMFCDIGLVYDKRTQRLIVLSAIDNLCRGASGQAVANANLMFGLPLGTGLDFAPLAP